MREYKSLTRDELLEELERLKISEAQHRSMIENVIDGFYRGNMDGILTFASPSAARIFGYSGPEEMLGRNIAETFYYDPEERNLVLANLMKQKVITNYRATLKHKDGSPFWAETNSRIVMDLNGSPIGVEGVFSDITARVKAEEKLRQSEYYYRKLFETTGSATIVVGEDSVIKRCNNHFVRLSSCNSKEVIENHMVWTDFVAPQDLDRMSSYHEARSGSGVSPPKEYEFIFRDIKGNHKYAHVVLDVMEGSNDRIASIIDLTERKKIEDALLESEERYRHMATTDGLTGLFNRRHFYSLAENEVERAKRHHKELSIIMLDIDHFKDINDKYGHDAGDKALQEVARHAKEEMRNIDVVARYGGEEFLILLPETSIDDAWHVAERLRLRFSSHAFKYEKETYGITASFGVNSIKNHIGKNNKNLLELMIKGADEALYQSKREGRNRITVAA